jgi:tetratricopeptide (TPR) repeat protein
MRGLAYLEKNDPDRAIADFGEAIQVAPDFAGFFGNRGDAYLLKKDWGHAVADYSQAIALMPDGSPTFYSGRAKAYEAQGDAGRAKADLAKADELGNKGLALTELMKCHRGSEGDALVAACTKVLAMPQLNAKQRVGAILNRGAAYANQQDLDRAMADYAEALRLDPNSAPAYFFRATAYMVKRDTAHAIADIGEAIRRSPKTADLYFYRGNAYSAQKDYSHAIADYSQAIALNPDGNASYYRSRATAYAAQGDKERAAADEQSMKQARHGPPVGGGLPELLRQDPLGR